MLCPNCSGPLSYGFSWTLWNPFDFRCPHCRAALKITNFVRLLVYPVSLGLAVTAAAITLEETGLLPQGDSLPYIVIASPAVAILWHWHAWRKGKFAIAIKA